MIPDDFLRRLKRYDRRLRVEREPGKAGRYRIVAPDKLGKMHVVIPNVKNLNAAVFKELTLRSPWKRNSSFRSWCLQSIDKINQQKEEQADARLQEVHEAAWEKLVFYRQNPKALRRRIEEMRREPKVPWQEIERERERERMMRHAACR